MQPDYQYLDIGTAESSIDAFWVKVPHFGFHWHYHPALEITYVQQGRGTRLVGDNVDTFESGDFVFLGSNLPHTWISDDDFNKGPAQMEVAVLQFAPELLSEALLQQPELQSIHRLLSYAHRGIRFSGPLKEEAGALLVQLINTKGFHRFSFFLSLLNILGEVPHFQLLASGAYHPPLNNATEERILNVCRFIHEEFTRPIKLETAARIANMNPASFCRFFKKSTGQSLLDYINDLRIGKACNLLLDKRDFSISQVAYAAGFNSQTLFNRIFQRKKKMTPSEFRRKFRT